MTNKTTALLGASALALTALAGTASAQDISACLVTKTDTNPFFVKMREGAEAKAQELGLVGTVKNLDDGRVEIHVAGDPAILDDFEDRVRQGPRTGRVDDLEREDLDPDQVRDDDRWQDFRVVR